MVEHFHTVTRHKIGGQAKAMVVTSSRLDAVRYKQSSTGTSRTKATPIKSLVAFSGVVTDDDVPGKDVHGAGDERRTRGKRTSGALRHAEYQSC